MNGVELLSERHIVGMIVMLAESDRRESEFLVLSNSYYIIRDKVALLMDAEIIEPFEVERSRGRWYRLTPLGREVAGHLVEACRLMDPSSARRLPKTSPVDVRTGFTDYVL